MLKMKKCKNCNEEKPISEYYKHKKMTDGHLNICKTCVKIRVDKREKELRKNNPEWVEQEKIRAKEKYKRLNYREKQYEWDKNKPWKSNYKYKGLNRNLRSKKILKKGQKAHHWNYEEIYLRDIFILSDKAHRKLHVHLKFNINNKIFIYNNLLLDTKEKHYIAIMNILKIENIKENIILYNF